MLDVAGIALARGIVRSVRAGAAGPEVAIFASQVLPAGVISAAQLSISLVLVGLVAGTYRAGDRWRDPARIFYTVGAGVVLALYSDLWQGQALMVAARGLLTWVTVGLLLVGVRGLLFVSTRRLLRSGLGHRVLVVRGYDAEFEDFNLGDGYRAVATVSHEDIPPDVDAMERLLRGEVDTLLVIGVLPRSTFSDLTDFALAHGCRLLCMPRNLRLLGVQHKRVWMGGHPLEEMTTPGLRASHLVLKRALDVTLAGGALILLSPILLVAAIWVRVDSPGPVLFRQRRRGFQGEWFPMLKFRSMRQDAEEVLRADLDLYNLFLQNDCKLPEKIDPRLTLAGRFLRKTSIDELPQLINVLRGDMSLVGPRPLVGPELENYSGRVPTLLSVKPGITGLWQVSGRSRVTYPERAEMDLEYVRNWSLLGDLWILCATPFVVLLRRGAH